MNARDSLLIALPTLVLGGAFGYLVGTRLGTEPDALEASAPLRPDEPALALGSSSVDPLVAPQAGSKSILPASAPAATEVRASEAEFTRANAGVEATRVEAVVGSGTIHGSVLDEDGTALQGAVVVATRHNANIRGSDPTLVGQGLPDEDSLKQHLRSKADEWAERRARRAQVSTGPDGAYSFETLVEDVHYDLRAYLEGYVVEAERRAYEISPGQTLSFRARRVYEVPVELVYADGSAPAEGIVKVERGDDTTQYKWSAESPTLRLVAGRVALEGYAGLEPSTSSRSLDSSHGSDPVGVDVLENSGVTVQLVLNPRAGIRGKVTDPWSTDDNSLEVRVLRVPFDGAYEEQDLVRAPQQTRVRSGRFVLLDLPSASYAVGVLNRSDELLVERIVEVGSEVVEVDLEIPPPSADENLVVLPYGPNGQLLDDVDFQFRMAGPSDSRSGGVEGRRAPDGSYWIQPGTRYESFFGSWPEGTTFTLVIEHSELGEREVELAPGQLSVEVRFLAPVSIQVVVERYIGSGNEGSVTANIKRVEDDGSTDPQRNWGGRKREKVSPAGMARFDGLEPGTWRVGLITSNDRWNNRVVVFEDVRVSAGERTVTLEMPALHDVSVHAPGLEPDTWLFLRAAGEEGQDFFGGGWNATLDDERRAVFEGLPAGLYVLAGNGVMEEVEVTVPGGEVLLDARTPDSMRVAVGDTEGTLYQAGFRAGDLVIGAGGKEFTNAQEFWPAMQNKDVESVDFIVLRGGERLTISMPRITMGVNWNAKLGGMFTPVAR